MIFYDIETRYLFNEIPDSKENVYLLEFGTAVTYDTKTDLYKFWIEEQKDELIDYLTYQLVVTFNGKSFDDIVLLGENVLISPNKLWYDLDLKEAIAKAFFKTDSMWEIFAKYPPQQIHYGFSLNDICQKTLGIFKNFPTFKIPALIRQKKYDMVFEYNLQDVRLLKKLFFHILEKGYVILGTGQRVDLFIPQEILNF